MLQSLPLPWEKLDPRQSRTSRLQGLQPCAPALAAVVNWDPVTVGGLGWPEEALESPNPSVLVTTKHRPACGCAPARTTPLSSGRDRKAKQTHPRQQTHRWAVRRVLRRMKAEVRWRKWNEEDVCTLSEMSTLTINLVRFSLKEGRLQIKSDNGEILFKYSAFLNE